MRVASIVLVAVVLLGSNCRNAPEERASGPGDAPSATDRATAQTPSGPGSGTGGATPSASRDGAGSTGNNPVSAREYAGTPGTTAQKPQTESAASAPGQCKSDEDCALTRFMPDSCCQDCEERPALRSEVEAKQNRCAEELSKCPMRNCAPSRRTYRAACVSGACRVAEATDG